MDARRMQDVMTLIEMDYREMPDLKLTVEQARRFFALPIEECATALDSLVATGFLERTREGAFVRRSERPPRPWWP
jgi:hypothetical protein